MLEDLKEFMGVPEQTTDFDSVVLFSASTLVAVLSNLGVPIKTYAVTKTTKWSDIVENEALSAIVRTWMYLKLRLTIDPPSPDVRKSYENQIKELEWRMHTMAETSLTSV